MEPVIWLIILIVLIVIEIITLGLTTIWFAGGSLVAFIAALCGAPPLLQGILFLSVSVLLLLLTRPVAMKYLNKGHTKTNIESVIGKKAVVLEEIDNLKAQGQVQLNGIEWTARAADPDQIIQKHQIVNIVRVDGVKLIVEIKEGE